MSSSAASYGADILRRVRVDAASWLAFAALLAWMFGLYWSDVQLGLFPLSQGDVLQMRALWLGSEAAALLVALLVAARLAARAVSRPSFRERCCSRERSRCSSGLRWRLPKFCSPSGWP